MPKTTTTPSFAEFEKRSDRRIHDLYKNARNNIMSETYSTETSTTSHISRRPDGSVYKETITKEKLADGSTKTTRVVDTTPAGGDSKQSRTETTVTTTPPTRPPPSENAWPEPLPPEKKPTYEERNEIPERFSEKNNGDQRNWTWWFWSRKQ